MIAVVALAFLGGCNPASLVAQSKEDVLARRLIDAVRNGDKAAIPPLLADELKNDPKLTNAMEQFHTALAQPGPSETALMGWNVVAHDGTETATVDYQIHAGDAFQHLEVVERFAGGQGFIVGAHMQKLPDDLRRTNVVDLKHAPVESIIFLVGQMVMLGFMVLALVLCARMPMRRKWAWILFIMVGAGKLTLNWTTGELFLSPLSLQLPLAGYVRASAFAPLLLWTTFPVGTVVFLWKRDRMLALAKRVAAQAAADQQATTASEPVADAKATEPDAAPLS
jgi:hypothetical protein